MKKEDDVSYKEFKALAGYIDRIGAEQLNFRRYMIKEHKARGYYYEKCLIMLKAGGDIIVTDKTYAPTKEEAEAIKAEMSVAESKFPKSILSTDAQLVVLKKRLGKAAILHTFYSRKPGANERDGNIVMVQQRVNKDDGDKYFVNWSFFNDGKWRPMEPDGPLPFWKPKDNTIERGNKMIMVHEGPKTAKLLNELKLKPEELSRHPFGGVLKLYEHWGMIGGALAPHRSDWQDLVDEKPAEVIYVADNDPPGKNCLQKVSECYGRQLLGIMFDDRFPVAFDLGDDFDYSKKGMDKVMTPEGIYIGPKWEDLLCFATRATTLKANADGKAGRPTPHLTEAFANEWLHCVTPEVFVHKRWPNQILIEREFNNAVRPFSDVDDTARLVKKVKMSKGYVLSYQPGRPAGIYADQAGTYINTHVGSYIEAVAGDPGPWLEFLQHLVPDAGDRMELCRWLATFIARPEIKMLYGVLLISEAQGIGKGTLGERILAPLAGINNVSFPSESEIVDSNYNYWAAHKRLAVVHEIYAGHSAKAYNKLKSIVTDRFITVQKKYQANYDIENWVHILACSNSPRAIQLSMDDRRWFVPKLTEAKRDNAYWAKLNRWLTELGGLDIIKYWANEFLKSNSPVMKGESAPFSLAKKDIIEEGFSTGMECVGHLLDLLRDQLTSDNPNAKAFRDRLITAGMFKDGAAILCDKDLVEYVRFKLYEGRAFDRIEKPGTLRKVAKAKGWFIGDNKVKHFRWGLARRDARLISLGSREADLKPELIELKPIDLTMVEGL